MLLFVLKVICDAKIAKWHKIGVNLPVSLASSWGNYAYLTGLSEEQRK